eukprot:g2329.t1
MSSSKNKKDALAWAKSYADRYPSAKVGGWGSKKWANGLLFCAICADADPENFPWHSVQGKTPEERLSAAFEFAEEHLGVEALLHPSDLSSQNGKPNQKALQLYILCLKPAIEALTLEDSDSFAPPPFPFPSSTMSTSNIPPPPPPQRMNTLNMESPPPPPYSPSSAIKFRTSVNINVPPPPRDRRKTSVLGPPPSSPPLGSRSTMNLPPPPPASPQSIRQSNSFLPPPPTHSIPFPPSTVAPPVLEKPNNEFIITFQGSLGLHIAEGESENGDITVVEIDRGGAAEKAGVKVDDVMVSVNGIYEGVMAPSGTVARITELIIAAGKPVNVGFQRKKNEKSPKSSVEKKLKRKSRRRRISIDDAIARKKRTSIDEAVNNARRSSGLVPPSPTKRRKSRKSIAESRKKKTKKSKLDWIPTENWKKTFDKPSMNEKTWKMGQIVRAIKGSKKGSNGILIDFSIAKQKFLVNWGSEEGGYRYYSPSSLQNLTETQKNTGYATIREKTITFTAGLGIHISMAGIAVCVLEVDVNEAADINGVEVGDVLIAINGNKNGVIPPTGTIESVTNRVIKEGKPISVTFRRERIEDKKVEDEEGEEEELIPTYLEEKEETLQVMPENINMDVISIPSLKEDEERKEVEKIENMSIDEDGNDVIKADRTAKEIEILRDKLDNQSSLGFEIRKEYRSDAEIREQFYLFLREQRSLEISNPNEIKKKFEFEKDIEEVCDELVDFYNTQRIKRSIKDTFYAFINEQKDGKIDDALESVRIISLLESEENALQKVEQAKTKKEEVDLQLQTLEKKAKLIEEEVNEANSRVKNIESMVRQTEIEQVCVTEAARKSRLTAREKLVEARKSWIKQKRMSKDHVISPTDSAETIISKTQIDRKAAQKETAEARRLQAEAYRLSDVRKNAEKQLMKALERKERIEKAGERIAREKYLLEQDQATKIEERKLAEEIARRESNELRFHLESEKERLQDLAENALENAEKELEEMEVAKHAVEMTVAKVSAIDAAKENAKCLAGIANEDLEIGLPGDEFKVTFMEEMGLELNSRLSHDGFIIVKTVTQDSTAEASGVRSGDKIVSIDDLTPDSIEDFIDAVKVRNSTRKSVPYTIKFRRGEVHSSALQNQNDEKKVAKKKSKSEVPKLSKFQEKIDRVKLKLRIINLFCRIAKSAKTRDDSLQVANTMQETVEKELSNARITLHKAKKEKKTLEEKQSKLEKFIDRVEKVESSSLTEETGEKAKKIKLQLKETMEAKHLALQNLEEESEELNEKLLKAEEEEKKALKKRTEIERLKSKAKEAELDTINALHEILVEEKEAKEKSLLRSDSLGAGDLLLPVSDDDEKKNEEEGKNEQKTFTVVFKESLGIHIAMGLINNKDDSVRKLRQEQQHHGVCVLEVSKGGAAEKLGVERGDVLIKINDITDGVAPPNGTVQSVTDLIIKEGKPVVVTFQRGLTSLLKLRRLKSEERKLSVNKVKVVEEEQETSLRYVLESRQKRAKKALLAYAKAIQLSKMKRRSINLEREVHDELDATKERYGKVQELCRSEELKLENAERSLKELKKEIDIAEDEVDIAKKKSTIADSTLLLEFDSKRKDSRRKKSEDSKFSEKLKRKELTENAKIEQKKSIEKRDNLQSHYEHTLLKTNQLKESVNLLKESLKTLEEKINNLEKERQNLVACNNQTNDSIKNLIDIIPNDQLKQSLSQSISNAAEIDETKQKLKQIDKHYENAIEERKKSQVSLAKVLRRDFSNFKELNQDKSSRNDFTTKDDETKTGEAAVHEIIEKCKNDLKNAEAVVSKVIKEKDLIDTKVKKLKEKEITLSKEMKDSANQALEDMIGIDIEKNVEKQLIQTNSSASLSNDIDLAVKDALKTQLLKSESGKEKDFVDVQLRNSIELYLENGTVEDRIQDATQLKFDTMKQLEKVGKENQQTDLVESLNDDVNTNFGTEKNPISKKMKSMYKEKALQLHEQYEESIMELQQRQRSLTHHQSKVFRQRNRLHTLDEKIKKITNFLEKAEEKRKERKFDLPPGINFAGMTMKFDDDDDTLQNESKKFSLLSESRQNLLSLLNDARENLANDIRTMSPKQRTILNHRKKKLYQEEEEERYLMEKRSKLNLSNKSPKLFELRKLFYKLETKRRLEGAYNLPKTASSVGEINLPFTENVHHYFGYGSETLLGDTGRHLEKQILQNLDEGNVNRKLLQRLLAGRKKLSSEIEKHKILVMKGVKMELLWLRRVVKDARSSCREDELALKKQETRTNKAEMDFLNVKKKIEIERKRRIEKVEDEKNIAKIAAQQIFEQKKLLSPAASIARVNEIKKKEKKSVKHAVVSQLKPIMKKMRGDRRNAVATLKERDRIAFNFAYSDSLGWVPKLVFSTLKPLRNVIQCTKARYQRKDINKKLVKTAATKMKALHRKADGSVTHGLVSYLCKFCDDLMFALKMTAKRRWKIWFQLDNFLFFSKKSNSRNEMESFVQVMTLWKGHLLWLLDVQSTKLSVSSYEVARNNLSWLEWEKPWGKESDTKESLMERLHLEDCEKEERINMIEKVRSYFKKYDQSFYSVFESDVYAPHYGTGILGLATLVGPHEEKAVAELQAKTKRVTDFNEECLSWLYSEKKWSSAVGIVELNDENNSHLNERRRQQEIEDKNEKEKEEKLRSFYSDSLSGFVLSTHTQVATMVHRLQRELSRRFTMVPSPKTVVIKDSGNAAGLSKRVELRSDEYLHPGSVNSKLNALWRDLEHSRIKADELAIQIADKVQMRAEEMSDNQLNMKLLAGGIDVKTFQLENDKENFASLKRLQKYIELRRKRNDRIAAELGKMKHLSDDADFYASQLLQSNDDKFTNMNKKDFKKILQSRKDLKRPTEGSRADELYRKMLDTRVNLRRVTEQNEAEELKKSVKLDDNEETDGNLPHKSIPIFGNLDSKSRKRFFFFYWKRNSV